MRSTRSQQSTITLFNFKIKKKQNLTKNQWRMIAADTRALAEGLQMRDKRSTLLFTNSVSVQTTTDFFVRSHHESSVWVHI